MSVQQGTSNKVPKNIIYDKILAYPLRQVPFLSLNDSWVSVECLNKQKKHSSENIRFQGLD